LPILCIELVSLPPAVAFPRTPDSAPIISRIL
jgi:hypothetical protein